MSLRKGLKPALCLALVLGAAPAFAEELYETPEAFVRAAFAGSAPAPQRLWITGALRDTAADILGEPPPSARVRYWADAGRSAWILEAIGKERPITAGFVVDDGRLVETRVLIYRESRGWEVRLPGFTNQFDGARLDDAQKLDRDIDGISGATLSVRAMQKLARLALTYDQARQRAASAGG